jgi:hypothetical protein
MDMKMGIYKIDQPNTLHSYLYYMTFNLTSAAKVVLNCNNILIWNFYKMGTSMSIHPLCSTRRAFD